MSQGQRGPETARKLFYKLFYTRRASQRAGHGQVIFAHSKKTMQDGGMGMAEREYLEGAKERTGSPWRVRAHRHGMIERVAHRRRLWVACGRKDPQ